MAQLVEQLNRNQQVGGSSPSCSTMKKLCEPKKVRFRGTLLQYNEVGFYDALKRRIRP